MGRKGDFAEPPWVYGPSEINKWIDAKYPSRKQKKAQKRFLTKDIKIHVKGDTNTVLLAKELLRLLKKLGYWHVEETYKDIAMELLDEAAEFEAFGEEQLKCSVNIKKQHTKDEYFIHIHIEPGVNLRGVDKHITRFKKKVGVKSITW